MKDTLQTEVSDMRLDEVKVLVSVVVVLLQRADGVTLRRDKQLILTLKLLWDFAQHAENHVHVYFHT